MEIEYERQEEYTDEYLKRKIVYVGDMKDDSVKIMYKYEDFKSQNSNMMEEEEKKRIEEAILRYSEKLDIVLVVSDGEGFLSREGKDYEKIKFPARCNLIDLIGEVPFNEDISSCIFRESIEAVKRYAEMGIFIKSFQTDNTFIDMRNNLKFVSRIQNKIGESIYRERLPSLVPELNVEGASHDSVDVSKSIIFELGVYLFSLISCKTPFLRPNNRDKYYTKLQQKDYVGYWEEIKKRMNISPSEELKDLLNGIMKLDPEERPTLDKILNHNWLNSSKTRKIDLKEVIRKRIELMKKSSEGLKKEILQVENNGSYLKQIHPPPFLSSSFNLAAKIIYTQIEYKDIMNTLTQACTTYERSCRLDFEEAFSIFCYVCSDDPFDTDEETIQIRLYSYKHPIKNQVVVILQFHMVEGTINTYKTFVDNVRNSLGSYRTTDKREFSSSEMWAIPSQ